jgi:Fe-S cluster assembly iron-binding protein IscA
LSAAAVPGLQYKVDLDAPKGTDKIFEKDGAKVFVDMKSLLYLSGTGSITKTS